ncbi:MAG: hypothetical protein DRH32_06490 [Deltaproteobacteria bacterium]|nr:MAG: hypothetical protein DRH32_06490 [Deltaproteobacteria bacterium]
MSEYAGNCIKKHHTSGLPSKQQKAGRHTSRSYFFYHRVDIFLTLVPIPRIRSKNGRIFR